MNRYQLDKGLGLCISLYIASKASFTCISNKLTSYGFGFGEEAKTSLSKLRIAVL